MERRLCLKHEKLIDATQPPQTTKTKQCQITNVGPPIIPAQHQL